MLRVCEKSEGYSASAETNLLLNSEYQVEKFTKHTRPDRINNPHSLFDDPSTDIYRDYVINTAMAGSVEIDEWNRVNFIWLANGAPSAPPRGVD